MTEIRRLNHARHYLTEPWGQRHLRTFPRGRRCAEPGCDTILSTYNPSQYCTVHDLPEPAPPPRHPKVVQTANCLFCGKLFLASRPGHKYCSDSCRVRDYNRRVELQRRAA